MFRVRLTWFWVFLTALALLIVGRLAQIQIVDAGEYQRLAERMLTRPPDYITAPRGVVYDRSGILVLSDEPTTHVCVHYAVLSDGADHADARREYLRRVALRLRERGEYPDGTTLDQIVTQLEAELGRMWPRLAELAGIPEAELRARAADVAAQVDRIRAAVQRNAPHIGRIAEEDQLLPIVDNVDSETALPIRLEMESRPWLRVLPATQRGAHDADALVHLLGRLGAAGPERIADDPLRDDQLRGLRAGDRCGITGVERLAETTLRGTRGRIIEGFDRRVLERREPIPGHDVYLTIDLDLQQKALALLEAGVQNSEFPSGGAAVVIDVATREVRALVSYPIYDCGSFDRQYDRLRRDRIRAPLLFRAVQAQYPPGSICKVVALIGALSEGVITPNTTFECNGHLLPNRSDRFRCWIYRQYGRTHGPQTPEDAVRNSCNIFFYRAGGLLGPERLCHWFKSFGLGQTQGSGLIEETPAIVPDAAWMQRARGRSHRAADAWNFAIGQGEVTATPLQAANVAAAIASGHWAPVRLAYDEDGQALGEPPVAAREFDEGFLRLLRRGMWRVVNEVGGTAHRHAPLDNDTYEMCGKTGSAQTTRRVLSKRYTCKWPDGRRETVLAISRADALARFADPQPRIVHDEIAELYPPAGDALPAHGWFIGYTQPKTTPRGAAPTGQVYAISVLVEFAGSGGRVAAPVAKQIAEYLLTREEQ